MGRVCHCSHVEGGEDLTNVAADARSFNDAPRTAVRVDERVPGPDPEMLGLVRTREPQKNDSPDPDVGHGYLVHAVPSVQVDMLSKARARRVVDIRRTVQAGALRRVADEANAVEGAPRLSLVEMERGPQAFARRGDDGRPLLTGW